MIFEIISLSKGLSRIIWVFGEKIRLLNNNNGLLTEKYFAMNLSSNNPG
jgi:hypothetical protein